MRWQEWRPRWEAALTACERLGGDARELVVAPPASAALVEEVERILGIALPPSFRGVVTGFSAEVELRWFLPNDIQLPAPLRQIFCGECYWSVQRLVEIEAGRQGWVEKCFPEPDDPYDRQWHNKLAFAEVENGDMLALDLTRSPAPVVYLSHDGGEAHGYLLGADFADFMDRWSLLGCPGSEDWQLLPFLPTPDSYLDPYGANAQLWREAFGLTFES